MREASFIRAVVNKLPKWVHHQSMTGSSLSHNGTPDRYFDSEFEGHFDLWVEFKYVNTLPKILRPHELMSDLQKRWLHRRYTVGRNVMLVVGCQYNRRTHAAVFETPDAWLRSWPREDLYPRLFTVPDLAGHIVTRITRHAAA